MLFEKAQMRQDGVLLNSYKDYFKYGSIALKAGVPALYSNS